VIARKPPDRFRAISVIAEGAGWRAVQNREKKSWAENRIK
jgi:hypothetical protein